MAPRCRYRGVLLCFVLLHCVPIWCVLCCVAPLCASVSSVCLSLALLLEVAPRCSEQLAGLGPCRRVWPCLCSRGRHSLLMQRITQRNAARQKLTEAHNGTEQRSAPSPTRRPGHALALLNSRRHKRDVVRPATTPKPSGIRAHRHRAHQLTKPGFWSLEKWGEMGGNGGKWGEMGGKRGSSWHSTQDVGYGGLWRDVVEENGPNGRKMGVNGRKKGQNTHSWRSHSPHYSGGRRSSPRFPL